MTRRLQCTICYFSRVVSGNCKCIVLNNNSQVRFFDHFLNLWLDLMKSDIHICIINRCIVNIIAAIYFRGKCINWLNIRMRLILNPLWNPDNLLEHNSLKRQRYLFPSVIELLPLTFCVTYWIDNYLWFNLYFMSSINKKVDIM